VTRRLLVAVLAGCLLAACSSGGGGAGPTETAAAPAPTGGDQPGVQAVIATDHGPAQLLVGTDAIFVGTHRGGTVQRIDPATNRVTATVAVAGQLQLEDSTALGGLDSIDEATTWLWACSNTDGVLHQIDPRAMQVTASVPAACDGGWRTRVGDTLWAVPGPDTRALLILDLRTGKRLLRVPLGDPGYGWGPAVTAGAGVIIGSFTSTPVFTDTGRPVRRIPVETSWLVSTGGHLYRVPADGSLAELDPTSLAVLRTYQVPAHRPEDGDPSLVGDGAGHLFYRPDSTHLYQVDLADGTVTSLLELPHAQATTGMAWAFGSLWVTNFGVDTIWRIKPR